ncbi:MAG: SDR family NAD(P)-dependent oxidoreductase [Candidatus Eremiobacteraeota bacterium]|nr:SDR family NAD(P)-dependent oxidoreductase [Candidatus Eremiobacteraeota bacterium]MCW5871710.1 SDR family NAD(P)-dependent oxidoreductase [Candidatus Eremiobacteraeota bacterium]
MANALITGASSGIGLSTARRLAQRGHQVLLLSYDEPELLQACSSLGPQAVPVLCDLSMPEQVEGLWLRLEESYGPIDTLINNAGIGLRAEVVDTEMADLRRLFEVNFFAAANLCRQAMACMSRRRRGHILNLTSAAARRSLPCIGAYGASKAALHGLTQSLRLEASGSGVTVSEVLPISVTTPFFARAGYQPRGLTQTPEQVAEQILLCLDGGQAERTTHWPTALGFVLDALFPNWVAAFLAWRYRRGS